MLFYKLGFFGWKKTKLAMGLKNDINLVKESDVHY